MTHRTTPRVPYIPRGVTQQGRVHDGQRLATCPDVQSCRMPLCACHPMAAEGYAETDADQVESMRAHRRVASWARGILLSILALLALVGAGALYATATRSATADSAPVTTPTRTTT